MWTQLYEIIFISVTLQAAVHLGKDYTENLRSTKNQPKKSLRQLFQVTERLITDQTKNTGLTTNDWQHPVSRDDFDNWPSCSCVTAKTYVFSDSVLCLWVISTEPVKAWESKIKWFLEARYFKDLYRIDWEEMEFVWKNFPGFTTLRILDEIQKMMTRSKVWTRATQRKDHLHVNVQWYWLGKRGKRKIVLRMLTELQSMLEDSRDDIGRFGSLDSRRHSTELMSAHLMVNGTKLLKAWCSTLPKADILYFVRAAPWKEENRKAKEKEWNPFTSTVVMKPLNWFFAKLFPSISSVSTVQ